MQTALNSAFRSVQGYARHPALACKPILSACLLPLADTAHASIRTRCAATDAPSTVGNGADTVQSFRKRTRVSDIKVRLGHSQPLKLF